jgi:serine/threonine-protein kinase RsbT
MNKARHEPSLDQEVCVRVAADIDVVSARRQGRILAEQLGFSASEATLVATAISELARNIVLYAGTGEIVIGRVDGDGRFGIAILAHDRGPGIADVKLAVNQGYSTSGGLGLGLPGVRRIMDEFEIISDVGSGTRVRVIKWQHL